MIIIHMHITSYVHAILSVCQELRILFCIVEVGIMSCRRFCHFQACKLLRLRNLRNRQAIVLSLYQLVDPSSFDIVSQIQLAAGVI